MNLIEKVYALLVCPDIRIWHYPCCKGKQFEFQFPWNPEKPLEGEKCSFDTMEEMIHIAYSKIDPLLKPLPLKSF
jgi:hypothetical protein